MKARSWIGILAVLTFGVGYSLGIITLRVAEGSGTSEKERSRESRRMGGSPGRGRGEREGRGDRDGGGGPYLSSVRRFADELELTEDQRTRLEGLIAGTTQKIAEHERGISNLVLETRGQVDALLTEAQRTRLEELIQASMRRYMEEKITEMVDWFRSDVGVPEDQLASIRTILEEYQEATGRYFRELRAKSEWPDHEAMEKELARFRSERDEKLKAHVEERDLERFRNAFGNRRRGR